jgi:hypothetical protein
MSAKGGEAYFVLAMERQIWLALRSFPRRLVQARFPPLGEVRVRPLTCCADDIGTPIFGAQIFAQTAEG